MRQRLLDKLQETKQYEDFPEDYVIDHDLIENLNRLEQNTLLTGE